MTENLKITGETIVAGARAAAKKTTTRRATKKAAPAHVVKQAAEVKAMKPAAKKATPAPKEKAPKNFDDIDWVGRLEDKDPSDLHVTFAKLIQQRGDVEITAKQVQAVLTMHPYFQKSQHNKSRPTYHGLDEVIVDQRSKHMVQAHKDAAQILDDLAAKANGAAVKKVAAKKAAANRTPAVKKADVEESIEKAKAATTRKAAEKKAPLNHSAGGTDTKPASITKKAAPARRRAAAKPSTVPASMASSNEPF